MQVTISILLILITINVSGQSEKNVSVVHKQEKYYLTKTCYDIIQWDEVVLKDNVIANEINATIRKAVSSYKLTKADSSLACYKSMNFNRITEFKVVYCKNNLISYYLYSATHYKGILHDFHEFSTLNFDSKTAQKISFNQLIDTTHLLSIDSLIIKKIELENRFDATDLPELETQLRNKEFKLNRNGIEILYWHENYPMSILVTYQELKPYVKRNGLLKNFYTD